MRLSLMVLFLLLGVVGCGGGGSEVVPGDASGPPLDELTPGELETEKALN